MSERQLYGRPDAFGVAEREVQGRSAMAVRFVNEIYAWMAGGLALSGGIAYLVLTNEAVLQTVLSWFTALIVLELVTVIGLSAGLRRISAPAAAAAFLFYAALNGLTFAPILLMYTKTSVANVFFVTAGSFGALAAFGAVTKRDLTAMGSFFMMGLFAIVITSVVNLFVQSSGLQFAVSAVGAVVFAGLTAYDVQRFKQMGYMGFETEGSRRKAALIGALNLYLDFINLFLSLLRVFGNRR